jgi:hypothetical protein
VTDNISGHVAGVREGLLQRRGVVEGTVQVAQYMQTVMNAAVASAPGVNAVDTAVTLTTGNSLTENNVGRGAAIVGVVTIGAAKLVPKNWIAAIWQKLFPKKVVTTTGGTLDDVVADSRLWSKGEFDGTRVYQRNDLIDPALVDARGRSNLQRMQSGLAPIGPDGKPLNLHHTIQRPDGPLAEMTTTFHQQNARVIHINPNTLPSGIDRKAFDAYRRDYWINRANDFSP